MALTLKMPLRILVIDDDLDLLMLLERVLVKEGYVVETAASLPEAEEMLPEFSPHVVLLDINVHGHDGRQLCWKLKKAHPPVFVILISGFDVSMSRAALFGADDLLPKPLHTAVLLERLDKHLAAAPPA